MFRIMLDFLMAAVVCRIFFVERIKRSDFINMFFFSFLLFSFFCAQNHSLQSQGLIKPGTVLNFHKFCVCLKNGEIITGFMISPVWK